MNISQENMEILNFEAAVKSSGGKEAIMRDMIFDLVKELPTASENAVLFLQKKEWEDLEMLTHKICGGANWCKMEQLNDIARKITTALRKKDFSDLPQQISELQQAIANVIYVIKQKWDGMI